MVTACETGGGGVDEAADDVDDDVEDGWLVLDELVGRGGFVLDDEAVDEPDEEAEEWAPVVW